MRPSSRLVVYPTIVGLSLLGGLAFGRPELIVIAVPFLLAIVAGLLSPVPAGLRAGAALVHGRLMEGDEAVLRIALQHPHPGPPLSRGREKYEVTLQLQPGLAFAGDPITIAVLPAGRRALIRIRLRCEHWGRYDAGSLRFRWGAPLGLFTREGSLQIPTPLQVYPRIESLRRLVRPAETQVFSGNEVARARGEGIEFAEIREYVPGDRLRHVNWRATGRRMTLQVNQLHPERNSDIVLLLDTFRSYGHDEPSIDRTVRAAISLAEGYLRQRDRVGVIAFGGVLRWLEPGSGIRRRYQIVEAILGTEVRTSYAWKSLRIVPPHTLPPKSLVIAITPLLDERILPALDELVGRGFDIALCEVESHPAAVAENPVDRLALRIFSLRQEATRARYRRAGVATVIWSPGQPVGRVIEEVRAFRRHARRRLA
jgi:uncharacterized protein (DUF58 family)